MDYQDAKLGAYNKSVLVVGDRGVEPLTFTMSM